MTSQALLEFFDIETAMTRKLLQAVPTDRTDWVPHPKSMPLGKLAMHVATLPRLATACLSTPHFDIATYVPPDLTLRSQEQLLATFDACATEARAALSSATEDHLAQPWEFRFGDRIISNNSRAVTILHSCLGHLIHHRAQLGTYLRLNDLPVPGVYGPSADDKQAPQSATT